MINDLVGNKYLPDSEKGLFLSPKPKKLNRENLTRL